MRLKPSHILRASGVTPGMVSTRKAWKMPMFTNMLAQPRLKTGLKMLGGPNPVMARKYGYRTGKKVG